MVKERTLSVNIPAGVEDGTRIRLAGEGEAGLRGGPAGDLYIFLSIKPHEFFQRDGADIFCRVPISMTTAALGGDIDVPTIDGGKTRVKVPEGTETGKQFRLKGKGMPVLRSKVTGDMYIQVEVETPKSLIAPPARAAGGVRAREQRGDLAALGRLLRASEGVLRGQAGLTAEHRQSVGSSDSDDPAPATAEFALGSLRLTQPTPNLGSDPVAPHLRLWCRRAKSPTAIDQWLLRQCPPARRRRRCAP